MVKVLTIGMTSGVGGVETFICNLKSHLKDNIRMDFLIHEEMDSGCRKKLATNGSKIIKITGVKQNIFKCFKELFKVYRENNYDIVHLNECDAKMFIYALPVLFNKNIKLIVHCHSSSTNNKIIHKFLNSIQNKRASVKLACSEKSYKWMFGKATTPHIIHNGIDINKFKYDESIRKIKRKELGIRDEIVIGSVARFTKEKNHEKIVRVFEKFHKQNNNSILLLVGNGKEEEKIKKLVRELNLVDSVLFLGLRDDIAQLLSVFDLFLLPSLYEGLPFVALEAQASSLPILATNTVSEEMKITDLVHFMSLDLEDDLWALEIIKILATKIDRNSPIYLSALKKVGYDINEVCKQVEEIYKGGVKK